ncbi:MAG: alpha/beta fold hydrolase [Spirochaetaceae bacterium]
MEPSIPTLSGIEKERVKTPRLTVNVLKTGRNEGEPVLFVHGNASSATFWEEVMQAMPKGYRPLACDLRGYGETEALPVDATLGLGDMVEDINSLVETMQLGAVHLVGHSMGGGVIMKFAVAHPDRVKSLVLVDTMSPYGYAGSKDATGTPVYEDGAPGGAAGVNPEFVELLRQGEMGTENQMAPRNVFRQFYVKPPFVPEREDDLLRSMLSTRIGDDWYPGDSVASQNWPGAAPGTRGIVNAFSRKYFDASGITSISPKPPVLWIRGADDMIVSNQAMFDIQALGAMGAVPGWPGADVCPPQPMLDQIEHVLGRYEKNGGRVERAVIQDAGHSPFLEKPEEFNSIFHSFL